MPVTVHVVAHTHWDREWYHPAARFGLRLVRLVDDLLDFLPRHPDFRSFLLDGQAIVLDDYLAARPEQEERLRRLFSDGRLEAGPWYVLADEFLVSAESLVRNLLAGQRTVRRLGGKPMAVGYSPDAFGHPAALPTLFRGFGLEAAVLWRGFGGERGQEGDLHRWRSADGSEVLMIHLPPPGYENGKSLPREPQALAAAWEKLRADLEPRARSPHWLVMAGADHHAAQHDLPEIVAALNTLVPRMRFAIGALEDYAAAVLRLAREHGDRLPVVTGELRHGHRHAWALQGTHGSRVYLKQANTECQRLLERFAEPLAALAVARGRSDRSGVSRGAGGVAGGAQDRSGGAVNPDRRAELAAAWRVLLENHPHDSICGTSADPVHREMTTRFERCRQQADEIIAHAVEDVVGHERPRARAAGRAAWRPALLVFNPSPASRSAVVEAEVALFRGDVSVGQQRVRPAPLVTPGPFHLVGSGGHEVGFQELETRDGHDLVESPVHYPLSSAVEWRRIALLARDLPPLGVAALEVVDGAGRSEASRGPTVSAEGNVLRNEQLLVRVEEEGTLEVIDLASGEHYHGLGELWDNGDAGDSYTYSAPRRDRVVRVPDAVAARVVHAGPLRAVLEIARRYDASALETTTRVTLDAGAGFVQLEVEGENRRKDHRLRVAFPLGAKPVREVADGHFGPVERTPGSGSRNPAGIEQPAPTAPMLRCVTAANGGRGLTVLTDGLPEYELRADGTLLVTLFRAFGQMSREDMPERLGHAGWPTPTPDAQCLGPFRARFGVFPCAERDLDDRERIERTAERFHCRPLALMRRSLLEIPEPVAGPALVGEGLVFSAMKPPESEKGVVLRCYNALARAVAGEWRVPWPVTSAELTRLDETPLASLEISAAGTIRFDAPPRAVVTVLLR
ncbi:MAG: glycoside hydrolase family 38 C-terminal domain-containing protein [Gemmatimonadales bacterium]|jgi:alpha-mannosidase